jgi:hypothetical protein
VSSPRNQTSQNADNSNKAAKVTVISVASLDDLQMCLGLTMQLYLLQVLHLTYLTVKHSWGSFDHQNIDQIIKLLIALGTKFSARSLLGAKLLVIYQPNSVQFLDHIVIK